MATAARPPNPADARVPCPLCGGLVHPIAGRCKHCKQDLTAYRGARPHAAVPLPALVAPPAAAPVPLAVAVAAREMSQPILPPRVTAQSVAVGEHRSMWRSWPTIVIALAIVAIVAAIAIMVYPSRDKDDKRALPPPPAPEHMDTSPLPSHAQTQPQPPPPPTTDPWANPNGSTDPDHQASIDPDDDLADPFGRPGVSLGKVIAVTGVAECDAVIFAYRRYFQCDALKSAGRGVMDVQRQALEAIVQGWGDLRSASQATKDAMAVGCRQALDSVRAGARAMGCAI